ncbi:polysaccharide biosynthesis/export family protein [Acinetobacter larvae]|uniref:Polysialic acid transporter n=1 Tax=Acinetobacter larvae TaxID=1789224 RepID=A0A1B2M233_9GAMM|nr:polysaccharide biosynthesis/export family protein [Acinetobacter larvae]AOA59211.1 polysialic acid transporter [Acinetobacter larvae]
MKRILLLSILSTSISIVHAAYNQNMLPDAGQAIQSAASGQDRSLNNAADQTILPNQSVLNLTGQTAQNLIDPNAKNMFGAQLFKGAFANTAGSTFNDSYRINPGDHINVRLWGAYQFAGNLTVDPEGNIFLPNVGPVKVAGTSNGNLQALISSHVRKIYVANVGVYAALEKAQPVQVLVTGYVSQPGNYGGVANDTVVAYLDRAGGVDAERGSYINVDIMRAGRLMQRVDLYEFLISGRVQPFSFRDGDIIVVGPRTHTFNIGGEVYNAYDFEFNAGQISVAQALAIAKPKPGATNVSILRRQGNEFRSEYYSLNDAQNVTVQDGDILNVTADRYAGSIQVRVEGAHNGPHAIVLPYGAKLSQVLTQITPNVLSNVNALQLYRPSVAKRQKEMLNVALDNLENATFNARSSTQEEANLRVKDAELVKQFIAKARSVQPKGQVVLNPENYNDVILEQGDVLVVPEISSVIMVHGEVAFPNAIGFQPNLTAADYISQVGGFSQKSNKSKVIVMHANGEAELLSKSYKIQQGDEILVLPKVQSKSIEVVRGITQIIYQIAVGAKIALDW